MKSLALIATALGWLDYRRTGHLIEEATRSLINGLLRDRSIEKDGQEWIRRV